MITQLNIHEIDYLVQLLIYNYYFIILEANFKVVLNKEEKYIESNYLKLLY